MSAEGTQTAFDLSEFETEVTEADEDRIIETAADGIGRLRDQIDDDTLEAVLRAGPGRYTMREDFTRDRLDPEPLTKNRVIEPLLDALGHEDYGYEAGGFAEGRGEQADYAISLRGIDGVDLRRSTPTRSTAPFPSVPRHADGAPRDCSRSIGPS
jgi:hypothetical protein